MSELGLFIRDDKVLVSSRKVAEVYEKRHDHVIRDIRSLMENVPETAPNFGEGLYKDKNNQERPEYIMDRQGYSILVTGFTGKKAKQFTYRYTLAFEKMAKELDQLQTQPQLPTTYKDALISLLEQIEENEKLELENVNLHEQVNFLTTSLSEVEVRKAINVIVQQYGGKELSGNFGNAWGVFYRRVYANTKLNLESRHTRRKTKSKLDCIDTEEEWQKVFDVAKNLYIEEVGKLEDLKFLIGQELNIKFD